MKNSLFKVISVFLVIALISGYCTFAFADDTAQQDDSAPFRIHVTVNGDAKSDRGFCWFTKSETDSLVEIEGIDPANITYDEVFEWEGNFCHKAKVTGLEPGAEYTYTVGSRDSRSDEGFFVTDDGDSCFEFIAIADVQANSAENFEKAADTVKAAIKTAPDAGFILSAGDYTNDSTNEEWDLYADSFDPINLQYTHVPVAGNHDGFGCEYWFNNMFNLDTRESVQIKDGVNYSFDYGNAHIAVVNTNDLIFVTIPQLKWLKNDMNSTDKDWKIIAMHKSPYTLGKDGKWPDAMYLQQSLTKVADECGVDLIISGHDHQYLRTKRLKGNKLDDNGATYVLLGTAGSKRYEVRKFLADSFMNTKFINTLIIQKGGYGNYWNGENFDDTKEENIGGCFNTVSIDGGKLTFNS
ncbi:MAG: metallophosphoesterase family protein, partial [Clostridia bacterium]|nr:metallophosphoesterase family protein [Clostridia bacterium]